MCAAARRFDENDDMVLEPLEVRRLMYAPPHPRLPAAAAQVAHCMPHAHMHGASHTAHAPCAAERASSCACLLRPGQPCPGYRLPASSGSRDVRQSRGPCSRQEGFDFSEEEERKAVQILDTNGDGLISFPEFVEWWCNKVRPLSAHAWLALLKEDSHGPVASLLQLQTGCKQAANRNAAKLQPAVL